MIAELYGKADGCAKGKAGSMHLIDAPAGVMGASAVVGTTIPMAVGYALAMKMRRKPTVVACFFGDGAVEEGVFHESLIFASLKGLPVLFVCENNGYAIHSRARDRRGGSEICDQARSHGIPSTKLEGMDILEIVEQSRKAVDLIRAGSGPQFLEIMCYRWKEHVGPGEDYQAGYRSMDEARPWLANDQVEVVGGRLTPGQRMRIEDEVEAEIVDAFAFSEEAPFPDESEL